MRTCTKSQKTEWSVSQGTLGMIQSQPPCHGQRHHQLGALCHLNLNISKDGAPPASLDNLFGFSAPWPWKVLFWGPFLWSKSAFPVWNHCPMSCHLSPALHPFPQANQPHHTVWCHPWSSIPVSPLGTLLVTDLHLEILITSIFHALEMCWFLTVRFFTENAMIFNWNEINNSYYRYTLLQIIFQCNYYWSWLRW